ncbi:hypothetical protein CYMTET_48098 [Cymbomonas tetramitiformis]|uniref:Methyltransferase domain-containing protein n=1 Tax=Cymbomonas tetramitiformis TaxID=36881 RepID=A0AAE0EW29_9CHLO|nr:hypothetical protein CYMTET_48098 [Cymbomonas tetramitiformis]
MSTQQPVEIYPKSDPNLISPFLIAKLEKEAQRNWDIFYKNNQEKFFKDRHYLTREFPELLPPPGAAPEAKHFVFEVGCGVGNSVYPLVNLDSRVFVHCCDFSPRAVELVKKHAEYDPERVNAFQCDITQQDLTANIPSGSVDSILMVFVLSAISPEKMVAAVKNCSRVLRRSPSARVFVRDYACGDLAQERLMGKKSRKICENFYARGDGTVKPACCSAMSCRQEQ